MILYKTFLGYFQKKLESIQYNAALAITLDIRGTPREKIYPELGLESLQDRLWYRKLCVFCKIWNNMSPKYLSDIIPSTTTRYSTRNAHNIPLVRANNNYLMKTLFPSTITEWNSLDLSIRKSTSLNIFKSRLLRFTRPLEDSVFFCHNPIGITYRTRIRLWFSHLRYHNFKHGFLNTIDSLCSCSTGIENIVHSFFHCLNFWTARNTFFNEITIADRSIIDQEKIKIIQTFLYGDPTYSVNNNKLILEASIKYILEAKGFEGPIF